MKLQNNSISLVTKDQNENKNIYPMIDFNNFNLINEMKIKQLTLDYTKIISKRNELIHKRKEMIIGNI